MWTNLPYFCTRELSELLNYLTVKKQCYLFYKILLSVPQLISLNTLRLCWVGLEYNHIKLSATKNDLKKTSGTKRESWARRENELTFIHFKSGIMMSFELSNLITDVWEGIRPDLILPSTHGNRRGEEQHFGSHSHQWWHTLPWNHTHTPETFIQWPAGAETFRSGISTVIGPQ